jgi:hypothetical protein
MQEAAQSLCLRTHVRAGSFVSLSMYVPLCVPTCVLRQCAGLTYPSRTSVRATSGGRTGWKPWRTAVCIAYCTSASSSSAPAPAPPTPCPARSRGSPTQAPTHSNNSNNSNTQTGGRACEVHKAAASSAGPGLQIGHPQPLPSHSRVCKSQCRAPWLRNTYRRPSLSQRQVPRSVSGGPWGQRKTCGRVRHRDARGAVCGRVRVGARGWAGAGPHPRAPQPSARTQPPSPPTPPWPPCPVPAATSTHHPYTWGQYQGQRVGWGQAHIRRREGWRH